MFYLFFESYGFCYCVKADLVNKQFDNLLMFEEHDVTMD